MSKCLNQSETLREKVLEWLKHNVSQDRLQHILGVEETCKELAHIYHLDVEKAAQAGLMHDLAKFFTPKRLLEIANAQGWEIDPICRTHPHLLHAEVSAIVAREEFGVKDEEILAAIAQHTLGMAPMSELSCVVFIADSIEPHRGESQDLQSLRHLSRKNLYQALQKTCEYSLRYLLEKQLIIHPRTIDTRNWALQKVKQEK